MNLLSVFLILTLPIFQLILRSRALRYGYDLFSFIPLMSLDIRRYPKPSLLQSPLL